MSQAHRKGAAAGEKARGAPKGRRGAGAGAGAGSRKPEDDREESLQAVVLADFETPLNPFTQERPKCLLPLANTPLIEYTLEFLAMSGVADVYIYCGAHSGEIERYIQGSKWYPPLSPASPFKSLDLVKSTARSVGDALRDLDARDLITGDFLLVHGDLVSNLPIDAALAAHRARRIADKNAMMTMILRSTGLAQHRTKQGGSTAVFVCDPTKNRCLHYEEIHPLQANKYLNLDPDLLSAHPEMEIRTNLIDCGIDICTPDVLALWAESFDYEVPRRHFLHGVLKDYELNGKTIHTEIMDEHYAARAFNLQSYDAISKDVLGRWTYPLVPDSNLVTGQSYKLERGGLCKEIGVMLARTCKAGKRTVLGKGTIIGEGSTLTNSTIGRRCVIGNDVTIRDAYIWDDVVIGDGATIDRAIIANGAVIGAQCKINPGALISFRVVISDNMEVTGTSRITRATRAGADIDEGTEGDTEEEIDGDTDGGTDGGVDGAIGIEPPSDLNIVGEGGKGYIFQDDDEDDNDEANESLIYSLPRLNLSSESISTITSSISGGSPSASRSRLSSFTGSIDDDGELGSSNENFHHDAVSGLLDTLKEDGDFDSAKLEFMGLRLSNDATDHQIRRAIAVAFTKRIAQVVEHEKLEASKAAAAAFATSGAEKFLKTVAVGTGKAEDKVDFIHCLQKDLVHRNQGAIILAAMCQKLYELDVIEEEDFLQWWEACELLGEDEDEEMARVRGKSKVFIDWLKEAEEESSSGEDDEDDSD